MNAEKQALIEAMRRISREQYKKGYNIEARRTRFEADKIEAEEILQVKKESE